MIQLMEEFIFKANLDIDCDPDGGPIEFQRNGSGCVLEDTGDTIKLHVDGRELESDDASELVEFLECDAGITESGDSEIDRLEEELRDTFGR